MTLDWQVIVICSAALFLRSLTGLRQLPGRALDIVDDPHPGGPERASAPEFRMQQARTDLRSTVPSGIVTAGMLTKEAITIPNETNSPKPPNPAQDLAGAEAEAAKKAGTAPEPNRQCRSEKPGDRIKRYNMHHGIFTK